LVKPFSRSKGRRRANGRANARGERSRRLVNLGSGRVDYSGSRWYWTPARRGSCHRCGRDVTRELIAYSFEDQSAYCVRCADRLGISPKARESRRARQLRHERLIEEAERVSSLAGTAA